MLAASWGKLDSHHLPIRGKSLLQSWQQAMEAAFSRSLGGEGVPFGKPQ